MPDTFNIGGVHIPKNVAYIGAGAIVIGGVLYYRSQSQAKAAAAANAAAVNAAGSTSTDPATGYPYGSPEDEAALAAQSQYELTPADASSSVGGDVIGYDEYGNPIYAAQSNLSPTQQFTTNAQWAQYAEQYLVNTEGANAGNVGLALGEYITGTPLTSDMVAIVQSAIAVAGYPPISGPNGNPPGYVTSTSSTTPTQPTPTPTPTPTPSKNAGAISNLMGKVNGTTVRFSWNPATGATKGYSYVLSELDGTVTKKGDITGTSVTATGLHKGWTYNFGIQALPGGPGNNIHVTIPN
jgi:hypothetical protein